MKDFRVAGDKWLVLPLFDKISEVEGYSVTVSTIHLAYPCYV